MNYTKPDIVNSGSAIAVVQSGKKPSPVTADADPRIQTHSNGAYEADE